MSSGDNSFFDCFDNSPIPTGVVRLSARPDGQAEPVCVLLANRAFVELTGMDAPAVERQINSPGKTSLWARAFFEKVISVGQSKLKFYDQTLDRELEVSGYTSGDDCCIYQMLDVSADKTEKQQILENFIKAVPGGFVLYKLGKTLETEYFSEGFTQMTGYSYAERIEVSKGDALELVYPGDRERLDNELTESMAQGRDMCLTYRIRHKTRGYIWSQVHGKVIGQKDGYPLIHAVFLDLSRISEQYSGLLELLELVVMVIDRSSGEMLYANAAAGRLTGNTDFFGMKFGEYMKGDDSSQKQLIQDGRKDRDFEYNGRCYKTDNQTIDWNGRGAYLCFMYDVTRQHAQQQQLEDDRTRLQAVLQNIPAGIIVFKRRGDAISIVSANSSICGTLGISLQALLKDDGHSIEERIHTDDRLGLRKALTRFIAQGGSVEHAFRIHGIEDDYIWVSFSCRAVEQRDKTTLYYACCADISRQKQMEAALTEEQRINQVALLQMGVGVWVYDIAGCSFWGENDRARPKDVSFPLKGAYHQMLSRGIILPDSRQEYLGIHKQMENGAETATAVVHCSKQQLGFEWARISYTALARQDGRNLSAIGVMQDVSSQVEDERRYKEEIVRRQAMEGAATAAYMLNLTQNAVLSVTAKLPELDSMARNCTVDDFFGNVYRMIPEPQAQQSFIKKLSRSALLNSFAKGIIHDSIEGRCRMSDGSTLFLTTSVSLMKNPDTGDVICFVYYRDISSEQLFKSVMQVITSNDYDVLYTVDCGRDRAIRVGSSAPGAVNGPFEIADFQQAMVGFGKRYVVPERYDEFLRKTRTDFVLKELENKDSYSFVTELQLPKIGLRTKRYTFYYLDRAGKSVLVTRSDITDVIYAEEKQNQQLSEALSKAERASAAKTDFLSRMSHDIRTPINAIVGITELAKQEQTSSVMADYLDKIAVSSRFLLGLVNDILDITKIEHESISLAREPYLVKDFITSVDTVIRPMMTEKNLEFIMDTSQLPPCFYTDRLRFNQIFFNILTNAAKFTPSGGRVELSAQVLERQDERQRVCFTVLDSGIGMSKDFVKRAFDPFEQESAQADQQWQGTGLGLTIVQNLVKLMGGTIDVQSAPGAGTTVLVTLTLERAEHFIQAQEKKEYDFSALKGKRVLLAEDNRINMMVAERMLLTKGMLCEKAVDGKIAADMFQNAQPGYYDAVLMDIRMPNMDGYASTRAMRSMERPDALTVPIIAMTANAFDDDREKSTKAGMNAHLAKPVPPQLLYETLCRLTAK